MRDYLVSLYGHDEPAPYLRAMLEFHEYPTGMHVIGAGIGSHHAAWDNISNNMEKDAVEAASKLDQVAWSKIVDYGAKNANDVGAVDSALELLYELADAGSKAVSNAFKRLRVAITKAWNYVSGFFSAYLPTGLKNIWGEVSTFLQNFPSWGSGYAFIEMIVSTVLNTAKKLFQSISNVLGMAYQYGMCIFYTAVKTLCDRSSSKNGVRDYFERMVWFSMSVQQEQVAVLNSAGPQAMIEFQRKVAKQWGEMTMACANTALTQTAQEEKLSDDTLKVYIGKMGQEFATRLSKITGDLFPWIFETLSSWLGQMMRLADTISAMVFKSFIMLVGMAGPMLQPILQAMQVERQNKEVFNKEMTALQNSFKEELSVIIPQQRDFEYKVKLSDALRRLASLKSAPRNVTIAARKALDLLNTVDGVVKQAMLYETAKKNSPEKSQRSINQDHKEFAQLMWLCLHPDEKTNYDELQSRVYLHIQKRNGGVPASVLVEMQQNALSAARHAFMSAMSALLLNTPLPVRQMFESVGVKPAAETKQITKSEELFKLDEQKFTAAVNDPKQTSFEFLVAAEAEQESLFNILLDEAGTALKSTGLKSGEALKSLAKSVREYTEKQSRLVIQQMPESTLNDLGIGAIELYGNELTEIAVPFLMEYGNTPVEQGSISRGIMNMQAKLRMSFSVAKRLAILRAAIQKRSAPTDKILWTLQLAITLGLVGAGIYMYTAYVLSGPAPDIALIFGGYKEEKYQETIPGEVVTIKVPGNVWGYDEVATKMADTIKTGVKSVSILSGVNPIIDDFDLRTLFGGIGAIFNSSIPSFALFMPVAFSLFGNFAVLGRSVINLSYSVFLLSHLILISLLKLLDNVTFGAISPNSYTYHKFDFYADLKIVRISFLTSLITAFIAVLLSLSRRVFMWTASVEKVKNVASAFGLAEAASYGVSSLLGGFFSFGGAATLATSAVASKVTALQELIQATVASLQKADVDRMGLDVSTYKAIYAPGLDFSDAKKASSQTALMLIEQAWKDKIVKTIQDISDATQSSTEAYLRLQEEMLLLKPKEPENNIIPRGSEAALRKLKNQ